MKKFVCFLSAFVALNFGGQCSAEVKTFHAESSYLMNRNEPIKDAQDFAFNNAVRTISEKAGVVINGLSEFRDNQLELDRVETFTAAVLRIKSKTFAKKFTADGNLEITAVIDAELDTDDAAEILNELREAKNSTKNYDAVLKDYTERKKNFDTIYGEYLGSYQKRIMRKFRDGCKLQNDGKFDEALKLYDEAIAESVANNAEISLAYVKRGHVYNLRGEKNLATADFERAIALNNDAVGVRYAKAVLCENRDEKIQAAQEYRAFVKDAGIVYYDTEITDALNKIIELEEVN